MRATSLRRPVAVLACAIGLGFVACYAAAQFGGGGRTKSDKAATPLAEGLRYVPSDAVAFVHVRLQDLAKGEMGQALLKRLGQDPQAGKLVADLEATVGIRLADLESATVFLFGTPGQPVPRIGAPAFEAPAPDPTGPYPRKKGGFGNPAGKPPAAPDPDAAEASAVGLQGPRLETDAPGHPAVLFVLTAANPLDRKAVLRAFGPGAAERLPHDTSALFLSDRSMVVGRPADLLRYTARTGVRNTGFETSPGSPLLSALRLAAEGHLVTAGAYVPADARARLLNDLRREQLGALGALLPLVQAVTTVTLDITDGAEIRVAFSSSSERDFALIREAAKSLQTVLELALDGDPAVPLPVQTDGELHRRLRKAVARATIDTPAPFRVEMRMHVDIDPELLTGVLSKVRQAGDRGASANQLREIGVAMHAFLDNHKRFPQAGIGKGDKALLSWRVALLPYLEEAALYKEFDLSLPWDHPHNKKLIARMPKVFAHPGATAREPGLTHYRVLVGPGTLFEPRPGPALLGARLADVTDGTSNTLMVVEAREPTIWTRPDDLPYDPKGPLPKFGVGKDGFNAVFADGAVHFIPAATAAEVLRGYITRSGGEVVPPP